MALYLLRIYQALIIIIINIIIIKRAKAYNITIKFSYIMMKDITLKIPRKNAIANVLIKDFVLASLSSLKYPYLIEISWSG